LSSVVRQKKGPARIQAIELGDDRLSDDFLRRYGSASELVTGAVFWHLGLLVQAFHESFDPRPKEMRREVRSFFRAKFASRRHCRSRDVSPWGYLCAKAKREAMASLSPNEKALIRSLVDAFRAPSAGISSDRIGERGVKFIEDLAAAGSDRVDQLRLTLALLDASFNFLDRSNRNAVRGRLTELENGSGAFGLLPAQARDLA